jgi:hypothetical protein
VQRRIGLSVNGTRHEADVEPRELLAYVLRERLGLTGTAVGCDTSACTVLVSGEPVKSCTMLAVQADGREIMTIEGLAALDASLHALSDGRSPSEAAALVFEGAEPSTDHAGWAEYRADLEQVLAMRAIEQALVG